VAETIIKAQERTEFGKGAARRTRRAGWVPAVLHSPGELPIHVAMPRHDTFLALRQVNAVIEIDLSGKKTLTIAREVQRHPVNDMLQHVDLMVITRGQKIEVDVPIRIEGEPTAGIAVLLLQELHLMAEATNVPEYIAVSIEGLSEGDTKHVKDLELPEDVEVLEDLAAVVVNVTVERMMEEAVPAEDEEEIEVAEEAAEEA